MMDDSQKAAKLAQAVAAIDRDALANDVLRFIEVKSETGDEGPGSLFFADLLRREGFDPVLDEVAPGRPNVYARWPGTDNAAPSLLLNGHTDTIPIGVSTPPSRDRDWVIGRGAEDMKGGLAAMAHAAAALKHAGIRLRGDLWLTGVVDHEAPAGKKHGPRRLIQHLQSGAIRADGIVIAEGPAAIWSASLGSTIFHVTIESPRGRIHTVKVPYLENPALYAGRLLVALEKLEREFQAVAAHPLCGHERINVGIVAAGDYFNRLPTPAQITGTWRWRPGKCHADVARQLREICDSLAAESGLAISVRFEAEREPFETPAENPLVRAMSAASEIGLGRVSDIIGMALVGDANLYANEAQAPVAYFGPAHETAHSDDERVSIDRLLDCAKMFAATAAHFCGMTE